MKSSVTPPLEFWLVSAVAVPGVVEPVAGGVVTVVVLAVLY